MKIIQVIHQKTKATKLWFSMVVVFIAMLSTSAVEAKSLNKGEEFKALNGAIIRINSSEEVEIDGPNGILLGKYTIDGDKMRVVTSAFGSAMVIYYKILPFALVDEKENQVFISFKKYKVQMINGICSEMRKQNNNAGCDCAKLAINKVTQKELFDYLAQQDRYFKERVEISRAGTAGTLSNDEIDNRRKSLSERERIESPDWVKSLNTCSTSALAQSPSKDDLPGFRIEADAVSGEPAIARGAEEWEVVLPKKLSIALIKAAPTFRILDPSLFAKRDREVDAAGIRATPNALIADFNGDGKSDLIVIGTIDNTLTAMAALSNRGKWIVQAVQLKVFDVDLKISNRIERYVRYFPKGTNLPDGSGQKSPGPGFSFFDDDRGGDLFFLDRGKFVRAIVVGD